MSDALVDAAEVFAFVVVAVSAGAFVVAAAGAGAGAPVVVVDPTLSAPHAVSVVTGVQHGCALQFDVLTILYAW